MIYCAFFRLDLNRQLRTEQSESLSGGFDNAVPFFTLSVRHGPARADALIETPRDIGQVGRWSKISSKVE